MEQLVLFGKLLWLVQPLSLVRGTVVAGATLVAKLIEWAFLAQEI